jgi:PAS domain S-box-containing protein
VERSRPRATPPPSLDELEGAGVVHGARWWHRATIVGGAACGVLAAFLLPGDPVALLTVVAIATVGLLVLAEPRFERAWATRAGALSVVAIAAAAWFSGGAASPLRHLLLLPVLYVAVARSRLQIVLVYALVAAVRLGLVLPGVTTEEAVELAVELVVAGLMAAAAYALRVSLGQASDRLRRTDELHRALVESHTSAIHVLDLEGRLLEINRRSEELSGYRSEDLVGRSSVDFIAPEQRERTARHFQLAAAGTSQTYETEVLRVDGARMPVIVTNVRIPLGPDRAAVLGIATDLTETLRERLARETMERRFERLAETMKDGIYVVRHDGDERQFVYVNPAMTELTGVPADEWYRDPSVGRRHVSPEHAERVLAENPPGQPYERPVLLRWSHPEGDRWLDFREVPWEDDTGEVVGVQGIVHDVTEVVRQQEAADAALEREQAAVEHLREVDAMKNAFLQSVSHELRTPLTTVVGLAATVEKHLEVLPPERIRQLLSRTVANAHKLERLLSDLLDVDRLSRGVLTPTLAEVDLVEVAARVLDESEELGGRVVADLQPTVVRADAPKVERIVENLLHNAVRHTPDDTPVWLRVAPTRRDHRDGGEIVVEDAGGGIDEELAGVLFEPFVQGTASARSPKPGTGIGLSLVARFTELHGGDVTVGERPGGGARFRVWLPADGRP